MFNPTKLDGSLFTAPEPGELEPEVCTLEHLIRWLETKPIDEAYCWSGQCVFEQYGQRYLPGSSLAASYNNAIVGFKSSYPGIMAEPFGIGCDEPHTFGAALSRARQALTEAK